MKIINHMKFSASCCQQIGWKMIQTILEVLELARYIQNYTSYTSWFQIPVDSHVYKQYNIVDI